MPSIKVTENHFSASGQLYGPKGLTAIIRALAIDNALLKIQVAAVIDFTDNSTGVNGGSLVDMVLPSVFDASSAGGAQATSLNTALGVLENVTKGLTNTINLARARLGLTALTAATGTEAVAGTIPAITKVVTTANGTSAADWATGKTALLKAKQNLIRLQWALNEVLVALGQAKLTSTLKPEDTTGVNLLAVGTASAAGAPGSSAVSKAAADAFLTAYANNVAHMAARWNAAMGQAAATPTAVNVIAG